MTLPARALGALRYDLMDFLRRGDDAKGCFGDQDWPSVWQLVTRHGYLEVMRDYREVTGQPVYVETDDNYLVDMSGHLQGVAPLANLTPDTNGVWVLEDVPKEYAWVDSPGVHLKAVEEADGVIVATENLATYYREHNDNVHVCRNGIDPDDWPELKLRDEVFRIVFAGSPTLFDLAQIREAMIWAGKQPDVEVWFVGFRHKLLRWRGLKEQAWFDNHADYRRFMSDLQPDVWLRPTAQNEFAEGKSDLKILEAAMVGALPIVTPSGAYRDWIMSGVLFATDRESWREQLEWCLENRPDVRRRADTIRDIVLDTRTMPTIKKEWSKVLDR